jgi:hypothetical protein
MDTNGFTLCAAYAACLARELLGVLYNADTIASGLEYGHLDDFIKRPLVELLVSAWAFTKTLSMRMRETNEKMAGFLSISGGL